MPNAARLGTPAVNVMPCNPLVVVSEAPAADPVDTMMPALGQVKVVIASQVKVCDGYTRAWDPSLAHAGIG